MNRNLLAGAPVTVNFISTGVATKPEHNALEAALITVKRVQEGAQMAMNGQISALNPDWVNARLEEALILLRKHKESLGHDKVQSSSPQ